MTPVASLRARDFMMPHLVTLTTDMELLDAIQLFVEKQISGAPVLDSQGNLVGILTERDCLAQTVVAAYHGEAGGRVAEVMSGDVRTVDADASLMDIAESFVNSKYRRYPVLEDNRLVGIISRRDVLRAVLQLA
jgi:CBS domain-containing protein